MSWLKKPDWMELMQKVDIGKDNQVRGLQFFYSYMERLQGGVKPKNVPVLAFFRGEPTQLARRLTSLRCCVRAGSTEKCIGRTFSFLVSHINCCFTV